MRDIKIPYDVYVLLVRYFVCEDVSVKQNIIDWIECKNESLQRHEAYSKKFKES